MQQERTKSLRKNQILSTMRMTNTAWRAKAN